MNPTDRRQYLQSEAKGIERRNRVKPCPFCGNVPEADPHGAGYGFGISCATCEYQGPWGDTPELAIYAWNTRGGK
jgi:Lar family restriction alleviation protein